MKKVIFSIFIILILIFLYGKYIEPNNFKTKEYLLNSDNLPNSFKELKIIHFSDILYKNSYNKDKLNNIVDKINEENSDIVIFSGDLLDKEEKYNDSDYKYLKEILKKIEVNLYKYAVIGDNDKSHLEEYKDILYESDFKLLDNENTLLFYKDSTPINILGITNLKNIDELLVTDVPYKYSIAITHEPDNFKELSNYNINTILSGHSLGGIINLPYYGGIIKKDGAKTYINDTYKLNNSEVIISNGIGYEKTNFRLLNTPSINIYKFKN